MMPEGPILLIILLILVASGFMDRVLQGLGTSPRVAVPGLTVALFGLLVDLPTGPGVSVNLGGVVLPVLAAVYLTVTAETWGVVVRTVAVALATAGAVGLISRWFPPGLPTELNLVGLDAQYLIGLTAAATGGVLGKSAACGFSGGVLGVVGADLAYWASASELPATIHLGGTGFHGTAAVAGVMAALLAHWVAENTPVAKAPGTSARAGGR